MRKKVALTLVGVAVCLCVVALFLPGSWEVERSITIAVAPAAVYETVAALRTWKDWTAWNMDADPECRWSFEGTAGPGSSMRWDGPELGRGVLTIESGEPETGITYLMELEGMSPVHGRFEFEPVGDETRVSWLDRGEAGLNPVNRWMCLFIDGLLGPRFDEGLDNLKARLEGGRAHAVEAGFKKSKNK